IPRTFDKISRCAHSSQHKQPYFIGSGGVHATSKQNKILLDTSDTGYARVRQAFAHVHAFIAHIRHTITPIRHHPAHIRQSTAHPTKSITPKKRTRPSVYV